MKFTRTLLFYTVGTIVVLTLFFASLIFILYHNGSPPNASYWYGVVTGILGLFLKPPKHKPDDTETGGGLEVGTGDAPVLPV